MGPHCVTLVPPIVIERFARRIPGLAALRGSLRRRFLGRGKPKSAETWDAQYRAGRWDGLPGETQRHDVVASLVRRFAPPRPLVLDVGCGQGGLARRLRACAGARYVGLDLSREAIARAASDAAPAESFHAFDVESGAPPFVAERSVNAAVFSEVLYYLDDPLRTVDRFGPLLAPDGFFVLSLWKPSRHRALLRRLCKGLVETSSAEVGSGDTWRISVCVPRSRAAQPA